LRARTSEEEGDQKREPKKKKKKTHYNEGRMVGILRVENSHVQKKGINKERERGEIVKKKVYRESHRYEAKVQGQLNKPHTTTPVFVRT